MDSEHGCVTSTDSSRDFCQLSAKSVDSQFIWCRKMPPHWLHFNNEHMVTWVSPPHLTVRTQVCVCCYGRCIHLCMMVSAHDLVCVSAPPHVTADVARSLCSVSGAALSTDLQRQSKIPLARLSKMKHLPGRFRGFCLTVKCPVLCSVEPAVWHSGVRSLLEWHLLGRGRCQSVTWEVKTMNEGKSAYEVEGADSWACK